MYQKDKLYVPKQIVPTVPKNRHVTFVFFPGILVFRIFFCWKIHFYDSHKNKEKIGGTIIYICFIE